MELEKEENDVFQENATTVRTLRNIRNTLKTDLINKGIIQDDDKGKEVVEALLTIHGLSKKNFDFVSSMENIISGRLNDVSIDDNSNKNDKSIVGLFNEVMAPAHKAIGYDYLYRMMKKLYGKKEAKRLTGELYDFSLALSDSTKILNVYCYAFDASKIVTQGRPFGQLNSKPPKRFSSYINALDETIHQMASHLAGAIAISSAFLDAAHMLLFKERYTLDDIKNDPKIRKYVENCWQTFVYSVNHLSRSGIESPFTNLSIFGREKIKEFISPDNMGWYFDEAMIDERAKEEVEKFGNFNDYITEYIIELERIFMDYFDKGDPLKNGAPYRFPVITINITKKKDDEGNYKILDQNFLDEICHRDIYRYNIYISEGTKTSMCCFDGNQKILFRNTDGVYLETFKDFIENYPMTKHISVFHNGFWKKFNKVVLENKSKLYKIITENNKEIIITGNHICPTFNGDKPASELTTDDYLLFNTRELPCSNYLKDEQLTYHQGFLIGCILGDGSFEKRGEIITGINLSLNENCIDEVYKKVIQAIKDFDIYYTPKIKKESNNVVSLKIHNKELAQKIITHYVPYNTAENKQFNLNLIENTIECRNGILDGWHITDGGNRWRNYSISKTLIDQMEVLCTSLGIQTNITVSDRTDEVVKIRDEEYTRNYPLYCLRTYRDCSKSKDVSYKWNNNSVYFKIKKIEFVDGSDDKVYCVEVKNDEPYFTLPNGIITHNCRLQLDTEDLKKVAGQVNSFGGSAMSMGSHRVITTNFNRVAVEATSMDDFYARLEQRVRDSAMILKAHKELILKTEADGLQPFISNGWIAFKNLFSTFGITAVYEAGKTLKEKFGFDENYDVVKDFLVFFNKKVEEISKEIGIMANIEQIPAESMAHRLVHADQIIFGKEKIPYELYSNQFVPLFHDATLYERMEADGKYNSLLTGGGICHFNLGSKITPEQAKKLIEYAVKCGCEHFALNSVWAECEKGHMSFGKTDKCPICGEKIINYYTRVIGYFSPVNSWNKTRRELDFPNRHFTGVDE